jgi:hypothetical protein
MLSKFSVHGKVDIAAAGADTAIGVELVVIPEPEHVTAQ